ncbi:MAG: hypothetical protein NC218_04935, partial [Acetobacter sp.]|nr:hypothetical protein [Acetobacter sp.]
KADTITATNVKDDVLDVTDLFAAETAKADTITATNVKDDVLDVTSEFTDAQLAEFSAELSDNVKITQRVVADADSIPTGTPSAFYTEERGGIDGTGLSADAIQKDKVWYDKTFYEGAYDDFIDLLKDEENSYFFEKGNFAEGVNPEILLHKHAAQAKWGNDKYGEFAVTITAMNQLLNGCIEHLDIEKAEALKNVMDRVNKDSSIDGVIGKTNVTNLDIEYNGCGEDMTYTASYSDNPVKSTHPSGVKFGQYYMMSDTIRTPIKSEPYVSTVSFDYVKPEPLKIQITEHRGNFETGHGLTDGEKIRDLPADTQFEVVDRQVSIYAASTPTVDTDAVLVRGNSETGKGLTDGQVVENISQDQVAQTQVKDKKVKAKKMSTKYRKMGKKEIKKHLDEVHKETVALLGITSSHSR